MPLTQIIKLAISIMSFYGLGSMIHNLALKGREYIQSLKKQLKK